ncbi:MAG: alpha/beta hydrolase [Acidobacteriota bacterium]|nr:alpha/beta hydrolase [Acidobacteriota bacterium]
MLDVYRPSEHSTSTVVILIHGGGWRNGSRKDMAPYAAMLVRLGFVAIAAEYRLLGEAPWPAQIEDIRDVVRWVRAQAETLGIDPQKIAIQGFSAGGQLALLAAGTPRDSLDSVAAVISLFAPTNLLAHGPPGFPSPAETLLGRDATEAEISAANPSANVTSAFPPVFLLHGSDDPLVPVKSTLEFFDLLLDTGVPADLHVLHGQTHEFAALPSLLAPVQSEVALFLRRAVVEPQRFRDENLELNMFASLPFSTSSN